MGEGHTDKTCKRFIFRWNKLFLPDFLCNFKKFSGFALGISPAWHATVFRNFVNVHVLFSTNVLYEAIQVPFRAASLNSYLKSIVSKRCGSLKPENGRYAHVLNDFGGTCLVRQKFTFHLAPGLMEVMPRVSNGMAISTCHLSSCFVAAVTYLPCHRPLSFFIS